MKLYSPLRYPGGKGKIVPYFKQIIKDNLLLDCVYIEPYAGGASVALSLLLDGYVSKIIINDIDRSIYAFWYSVLNETDKLCSLIEKTPVNINVWKKQKAKQRLKEKCGLIELGFSTFFLNRTNRSGILDAGVIGGLKQSGKWKIDARYNKQELINRIRMISQYKNRIELYNSDAAELIKLVSKSLPKKALFYFDPPYYVNGKNLYLNYYVDEDHKELSQKIRNLKTQNWILTYDNVKSIRRLYASYRQKRYNLRYSAAKAGFGQELMIFSNNMYVPK
ncbi:DNA adenine methylase, partial [Candidatus Micrarchaeota archaeon]|nr:DNA adenine methylase [Candidatus Micrarchaeota archaeon]